MRGLIFFIIVFLTTKSSAQKSWTDKFTVKTTFEIGQIKTYQVSEFFKIDNILFGDRYEVESTVSFQVIDSANGGYWIIYNVTTNATKQHKDSSAYFIGMLLDGINLYIYAKNGQFQLDSTIYFYTKEKVADELDSISTQYAFGKTNKKIIQNLKSKLKEDAGLGFLLAPLMLFEEYYSSSEYKKFRTTKNGQSQDILKKQLFNGEISQELKSIAKDSIVNLDRVFIAHPVSAAQYHKSIYEPILAENNIKRGRAFWPPEMRYLSNYAFYSQPSETFPKSLYKKVVSEYIFRTVLKIEMIEM